MGQNMIIPVEKLIQIVLPVSVFLITVNIGLDFTEDYFYKACEVV